MSDWQEFIDSICTVSVHMPSPGVWLAFGSVLVLLLCSGFVSASEIAFFSLTPNDRSTIDEGEQLLSKYISH